MQPRVIHIEPLAPSKPTPGAPCNGCGVCCLGEPCPVGMLWSRQRRGPCRALLWEAGPGCYRCGLLVRAAAGAGQEGGLRRALMHLLTRGLRRWIGAGAGCDCDWLVAPAEPAPGVASSQPLEPKTQVQRNGT